eukprot:1146574-Pelagomonas_calceolata.AAC.5
MSTASCLLTHGAAVWMHINHDHYKHPREAHQGNVLYRIIGLLVGYTRTFAGNPAPTCTFRADQWPHAPSRAVQRPHTPLQGIQWPHAPF